MHQDLVDLALLNPHEQSTSSSPSSSAIMKDHAGATDVANAAAAAAEAQCPVDHKTRDAWLAQARAAQSNNMPPNPHSSTPPPGATQTSNQAPAASSSSSSSSSWGWRIPFLSSSSPTSPQAPPNLPSTTSSSPLGTHREVSSIPRASDPGASTCPVPAATSASASASASNHEVETGADAATGNWVYPSEKMFFDAMRRKGHGAEVAADMRTVVPIHNAVNERAWAEIREWERPYEKDGSCPGGPRLHSFMGLSNRMSPRARMNTLLGYTAPFDRHDWIVDRCGTKVEYVIDFYAGSSKAGAGGSGPAQGKINFYLDVRPKLNSWEGVKMRAARALGLN